MNLHDTLMDMGDRAVAAERQLATLGTRRKNIILEAMADSLDASRAQIKEANARDMAAGREAGLSDAMLDRLLLTDKRMDSMINGVRALVALKDPVGQKISRWVRPNGLIIQKIRTPIGVIGIIFESRPNVTVDAAALCFKTSNAVILRGGREAIESNI
ncbi:MAG: gamma-glutamyl-phosphate reductase, partial [Kiritimatiellae bacterium]|nr:gamma-glutamyl-phosphate reductase [Kiritimatiellia bacterium]